MTPPPWQPAPGPRLDAYRAVVGHRAVDELYQLASRLAGKRVQHVNATRSGGGVAEILNRMIPLLQELGVDAVWDVLRGEEEFYRVTKAFHNAIQGEVVELTPQDFEIFVRWNEINAREIDLHGDFVVIHDPQPAAMPFFGPRARRAPDPRRPIVWRCHIDASHPHRAVWTFLEKWVRRYDATLFSAPQFAQALPNPRFLVAPAIDPLSDKNRELARERIEAVYEKHGIDLKRPTLVQISRFDRWKDPLGVIRTYRMVKETNDCQLVLAGGGATDDPEGAAVLAEVQEAAGNDPDLHVLLLPPDAHLEVNALQRGATIILQKSVREGFGLTVSEGLWKGKPVIGGSTGGIPLQVLDGVTGYLVASPEGAAFRARFLLNHPEIAAEMGRRGVEMVRQNFLVTRNVRDYLVLFLSLMTGERHFAL
jgi:trehalose synthase